MKTRLLRKFRKLVRKKVYIAKPKHVWGSYYIQGDGYQEYVRFRCNEDFEKAEKRVAELRKKFMIDYIYKYKQAKERAAALKRINRFTF